jgi:hypothetical protein
VLVLWFLTLLLGRRLKSFNRISAQWAEAIVIFILFLFNWGYFTLFEAFWNGRTPGKRVAKIRVIQRSGRSIGLVESMARNLVRYVDMQPFPILLCGGRDHHVCDAAASAAGRPGGGHAGGARPGAGESAMGRYRVAHVYGAAFLRQCGYPGAAPGGYAAGDGHCEALFGRPGGAGGVLFAAAGYEHGHAAGAGARIAAAVQAKSGWRCRPA